MTDSTDLVLNRRNFLRGRVRPEPQQGVPSVDPIRPPWTEDATVQRLCTSCGDCVSACPEAILIKDQNGRPSVSFDGGECTFCGACVDACQDSVFDRARAVPWPLTVSINMGCLLNSGVMCQLCTDACDASALTFDMRVRPNGAVILDPDACTGCGACIAMCPVRAIEVDDQRLRQWA